MYKNTIYAVFNAKVESIKEYYTGLKHQQAEDFLRRKLRFKANVLFL
jgi:hypothetical protein